MDVMKLILGFEQAKAFLSRNRALARPDALRVTSRLRPPAHRYRGYSGPWIEDYFFRAWASNSLGTLPLRCSFGFVDRRRSREDAPLLGQECFTTTRVGAVDLIRSPASTSDRGRTRVFALIETVSRSSASDFGGLDLPDRTGP